MNAPTGDQRRSSLEREFSASLDALLDSSPLHPGDAILVGCSAGGDSIALMTLLQPVAVSKGWNVHVAHFDHAQRPESRIEASFIQERCVEWGVAFHLGRLEESADTAQLDEGRLRDERYRFFKTCMDRTGAQALFLAHQADDRAETLLMRLMRGSGLTGMASIRGLDQVRGMTILRPLLRLRREALRQMLRDCGASWLEDPSNEDERFKRVWVRRELLPLMNRRMGMDLTDRLVRASEIAEEESRALQEVAARMLHTLESPSHPPALGALNLASATWSDAGPELRRVLLRTWLWDLREGQHPPGFETVREALRFIERGSAGTRHRTVERIQLTLEPGRLVAWPEGAAPPAD